MKPPEEEAGLISRPLLGVSIRETQFPTVSSQEDAP